MIACNRHGHPPLDPDSSGEAFLDLPHFYLDLMFGDPVEEQPAGDAEEAPEQLVA